MSIGTLYTPPNYYRSYKIQIAATLVGAQLKVVPYVPGETDATPAFTAKFPKGFTPVFESTDGKVHLFEANAIAEFVAGAQNKELTGGDDKIRRAQIQQWIHMSDQQIVPAMATLVYPALGVAPDQRTLTAKAKEVVTNLLNTMNNHLKSCTYLVGERLSNADIAVWCNLLHLFEHILEPNARSSVPHVVRWFTTLAGQPAFSKIVPSVHLCTKEAKFDGKKYADLHAKAPAAAAVDHKKAEKGGGDKKKEPKAPTPAKPKAKPAEEEEDLDEAELEKKTDDKDPFAAYPPSATFNVDEFKRTYSNNDAKTVAIPFFWEKFDPQAYSLWYCEYKFPEELRLSFMSCNLIGGMFQRLDRMRKHAFASVILFGEDNKSTISGVWFWKGHDLAFTLHSDIGVDYDSYDWKKLDYNSPETKTLVNEYFAHEGNFGGKKFNTGKIYK